MDLVTTAERIPLVGETIAGRDFQTHHGGKGANQAVAIARLGYPVELIAQTRLRQLRGRAVEGFEAGRSGDSWRQAG